MRILVTGGTGYVGSHAAAALHADGHAVRLLVRRPERVPAALSPLGVGPDAVDIRVGDVLDARSVATALEGCEAVLHAAAVYSFDPRDARGIRETNVRATEVVLGAANRLGLDPIVHVSSYGALLPPNGSVLGPDEPLKQPSDPYCASKAAAERVARDLQTKGAPVTIVQPVGLGSTRPELRRRPATDRVSVAWTSPAPPLRRA